MRPTVLYLHLTPLRNRSLTPFSMGREAGAFLELFRQFLELLSCIQASGRGCTD